MLSHDCNNWICPDITPYWRLGQIASSNQVVLLALHTKRQLRFSMTEGYALRFFTGQFTVSQVQTLCERQFGNNAVSCLVTELLQTLMTLEVLALPSESTTSTKSGPQLKSCVQWVEHPEGYWILRNPEDVTYLQVSDRDKAVIDQLGQLSPTEIVQTYTVSPSQLQHLLQLLAATGMLVGSIPATPPKRKFTPMQLLFFKVSLFNPDPWLNQHIDLLRWVWSLPFCLGLSFFLACSAIIGLDQWDGILQIGQQIWATQGATVLLPFGLLAMLVVTIHELGHAFTLKHYGGIVPEIGLMFMFFMPAAYTNTTDAYALVSRSQRVLVVAAGVLCQIIIAAIALCLWNWSVDGTWLNTASYLLMVAALFTVAVNLNPLARFDGYYLAVALTGINNLRSRSFGFYANLFRRRPLQEKPRDCWILATYAPFSFAYVLLVFGVIFYQVLDWTLTNIPTIALTLLTLWAIYFYWPSLTPKSASTSR
ncbi:hypothetical protein [Trichocoleus sp. FACHB-591]|uniref:hypothetical protein n=1 Tax=Trichocoleus sp. FACHB-591 TaxID=2692872 RepID=UPI0018F02A0E|nr:hypothetical protein [Trichocoleus sp. FACHB-591]